MTDELKPVPCGCGGEARIVYIDGEDSEDTFVECTRCKISVPVCPSEEEAVEDWNRAMGAKDINVPNKFATDTNVGDKERTAKVEEDEWTEHKMLSRDYGKIYYQHDCCCDLYESPYQFCPNCGMKMKRGDR